jgi:hypothetical protein
MGVDMLSRYLKNIFVFSAVAAGIFAFVLSCDNPFKAGLGPKVDIEAPVIHWFEPDMENFVKGAEVLFKVNVTDDIGISGVNIYFWRPGDRESDAQAIPMVLSTAVAALSATDQHRDVWVYNMLVEDEPMSGADGELLVKVIATDTSKKTDFKKMSYSIKNQPPDISVSYPYIEKGFWNTVPVLGLNYDWGVGAKPSVYTRDSIRGIVVDAQGIRPRDPQIRFLKPNETEPDDPEAGWKPMDEYMGLPSEYNWKSIEPTDPNFQRITNIGFEYALFERDSAGNKLDPLPDSSDPYKFRIRAWDSGTLTTDENGEPVLDENGQPILKDIKVSYFPPLEKPAAEVFITGAEGAPKLDLYFNKDLEPDPDYFDPFYLRTPTNYNIHKASDEPAFAPFYERSPYGQDATTKQKYAKERFVIEARVRYSRPIAKALLVVSDNSSNNREAILELAQGLGAPYNTTPFVESPIADPRWILSSRGVPEREYLFLSHPIGNDSKINTVDANGVVNGTFGFGESEYEFFIRVLEEGMDDLPGNYTEKSILVRITNTKPVVEITAVSPNTEEDFTASPAKYTVNGHINVIWTADAGYTGFATDDESNARLIKYLVSPAPLPIQNNDYGPIFNMAAKFATLSPIRFDTLEPTSPLYAPNVTDPNVPNARTCFLYIVAQDKAGLIGGTYCEITIDQSKDFPVIALDDRLDNRIDSLLKMTNSNGTVNIVNTNDDGSSNNITIPVEDTINIAQNWMGSSAAIVANLSDDDGLNMSSGIEFKLYDKDGNEIPDVELDKPASDRKSWDLNYRLNDRPEGVYYFTLSVEDSETRKNTDTSGAHFAPDHDSRTVNLATYDGNDSGQVWFILDREPPKVRARHPVNSELYIENLNYNASSPFPLTVEAFDTGGLSSIIVLQRRLDVPSNAANPNRGVVIENFKNLYTAYTPGVWEVQPIDNLPRNPANPLDRTDTSYSGVNGTYEYTVVAVDKTGQQVEARYIFDLDNGNPVIRTINYNEKSLSSSSFTISGFVRDRGNYTGTGRTGLSAISQVYWTLTSGKGTPVLTPGMLTEPNEPPSPWKRGTSGVDDWSITVDAEDVQTMLGTSVAEGRFWLHVVARDAAGNLSTTTRSPDDVAKDNWPGAASGFTEASELEIQAEIGKVEIYVDKENPAVVWKNNFAFNPNVSDPYPTDGADLILSVGSFGTGTKVLKLGENKYAAQGGFTLTFTAMDSFALRSVLLERKVGNGNFEEVPLNTSPLATVTRGGYMNGVRDNSLPGYATVTVGTFPDGTVNEQSLSDPVGSTTGILAEQPFRITDVKATLNDGAADGDYQYRITVTDFVGKVRRYPESGFETGFTVKVDRRNPVVRRISTPASISTTTKSFTVTGLARDPDDLSAITHVYYAFNADRAAPSLLTISEEGEPATGSGWTKVNPIGRDGNGNWNWQAPVNNVNIDEEDIWFFHAAVRDESGRISAVETDKSANNWPLDESTWIAGKPEIGIAGVYVDIDNPRVVWKPGFITNGSYSWQAPSSSDQNLSQNPSAITGANRYSDGYYYAKGPFNINFAAVDSYALRTVEIRRSDRAPGNPLDLSGGAVMRYGYFAGASVPSASGQAGYNPTSGIELPGVDSNGDIISGISLSNPAGAASAKTRINAVTVTLNQNGAGDTLPDGEYTYEITVTDFVGKETTSSFTVVVDTQPPVISKINKINPDAGSDYIINPTFSVTGTVKDPSERSPVTHVYWRTVDAETSLANVFAGIDTFIDADGNLTGSNNPWNRIVLGDNDWNALASTTSSSMMSEGNVFFYAAARDAAGNLSRYTIGTPGTDNWPSVITAPDDPAWVNGKAEVGKKPIYIDINDPQLVWDAAWANSDAVAWATGSYPSAGELLNLNEMFAAATSVETPAPARNPFTTAVKKPDGEINYFYSPINGNFGITFTAIDTFALGFVTVERTNPSGLRQTLIPPQSGHIADIADITLWGAGNYRETINNAYTHPGTVEKDSITYDSFSNPDAASPINVTAAKITFSQNGLSRGAYTYRVTATDFVGKSKIYQDFTVIVDDVAPSVTITGPTSAGVTDNYSDTYQLFTVNGVFRFDATSADQYGVEGSKWWLLKEADSEPDWGLSTAVGGRVYAGGSTSGLSLDERLIDTIGAGNWNSVTGSSTTAAIPNDNYILYVMAKDKAGNTKLEKRYICVDQSTDLPGVTISSPTAGSFVPTVFNLLAELKDDDYVKSYTIQYTTDGGANWNNVAGYIDVPVTPAKVVGPNVPISAIAPFNSEGLKTVRIIVKDDNDEKLWDPAWGPKEDRTITFMGQPRSFTRDTQPPDVKFTNPDPDSVNRPIYNSVPAITGTIVEADLDDITDSGKGKPAQIKWTLNDGRAVTVQGVVNTVAMTGYIAPVAGANPNWTWLLNSANTEFNAAFQALPDGSQTLRIEALDRAGQPGSAQTIFTKDMEGPSISLNPPFMSMVYGQVNSGTGEVEAIGGGNIASNSISASTITLSGTFNDSLSAIYRAPGTFNSSDPGNVSFWYKVEGKTGYQNNVVGKGWLSRPLDITTLSPDSRYLTWRIDLPSNNQGGDNEQTADGNYLLSIRVKDYSGNGYDENVGPAGSSGSGYGFVTNLAFTIERGIPMLEIDTLEQFQSGDITFDVTVSNTSGVKRLEVKQGTTHLADWGVGANPPKNITPVNPNSVPREHYFTVTIPAAQLTEGNYNLVITATGPSDFTAMDVRAFIYDKTPPAVTFTAPHAGTQTAIGTWGASNNFRVVDSTVWVTGAPQISGTTSDTNGVKEISYHLGKLNENSGNRDTIFGNEANWTPTGLGTGNIDASWGGGLFYWTFQRNLNNYETSTEIIDKDTSGSDNGGRRFYIPLYVRVTDQAGNINVTQYRIYVDPDMDMPHATIINPVNNNDVGGTDVRISGTASDNQMVHSVEIRIRPIDDSGLNLVNGYYKDNNDAWAYPTATNPIDQGWIKTTLQGDQQDIIVSWSYFSNKNGSLTPSVAGQRRQVTIEVRALDTKELSKPNGERDPDLRGAPVSITVYFASGVPDIDTPKILKAGLADVDSVVNFGYGLKTSGTFKMTTTVKDDGGISSLKARVSGGNGYVEIVRNGAVLTNTLDLGGGAAWVISGQPVSGSLNTAGRRYQLNTIPATAPDWSTIDLDYDAEKKYEEGTWIKLKSGHGDVSGITGFMTNGGNAAANDGDDNGWNSQFFKYDLEFTIDSLVNLPYGSTGRFTLDLQVLDNNQVPQAYSANGSYALDIDNFYPNAVIQTQYNAVTANFYVKGTAVDYGANSGTVQGLARMLVYFSRIVNGNRVYYNAAGAVSSGMTTRPNVRDTTKTLTGDAPNGSLANFPVLNKDGNTWKSLHAMVIDRQELGDTTDTDGDGTMGEMWDDKGTTKQWQARLNTRTLTDTIGDGPLTVHYVIMDEVGNATHYQEDIYVGNNKPWIREITLGTNLDGGGINMVTASPISVGETAEGNREITTNFRVRNSRFGLKLNALYGNVQKHYRVYYVVREDAAIASTAMVRGNVYTIAAPGNTDWVSYGALNNNTNTTFVASGPARAVNDSGDATTGTVYAYTEGDEDTQRTGAFSTANNNGVNDDIVDDILFDDDSFGAALIPDSSIPANPPDPANPTLQHDRRFIIKVYDETISGGTEAQQLAHVALINVDINNVDTVAPVISFAPFGKEFVLRAADNDYPTMANNADRVEGDVSAYTRNVVTTNNDGTGTRKGYVQYAVHDTTTNVEANQRANVSGMVIFRGKAADNGRIDRITAQISYYPNNTAGGTEFDIATWDDTALVPADNTTTINAMRPDNATSARGFEPENHSLTLDYSHVVNWSFAWDTSTVTSTARNNVTVTFRVYDAAGTVNSVPASVTVNIVPYITEIVTSLPSNFDRSAANGWYPVREGEVIDIRGFNLNNAANGVTANSVAVGSTNLTNLAVGSGGAKRHIRGTVPAAAVSGNLVVTVNGVDSFNNRNNDDAVYNKEPNNVTSNILTDNRGLYVWNTGLLVNSVNLQNPIMRVSNAAGRRIVFGTYFGDAGSSYTGQLKLVRNNDGLSADGAPQSWTNANNAPYYASVLRYTNRFVNNALGITPEGEWAVAASQSTSNGPSFVFAYNNIGLGASNAAGNGNGKRYLLKQGDDINRLKPRIAMQRSVPGTTPDANSPTRAVLAYYDNSSGHTNNNTYPIILLYGLFHTNNYLTGGQFTESTPATSGIDYPNENQVATRNSGKKSSQHLAAGILSNGRAVIAWYDSSAQCLWFSYGDQPTGATNVPATSMANWQDRATQIKEYAGTHVDLAVDGGNNIHLAYVDARNGGLWYTYIPAAAITGTGQITLTNVKTVRVDTYLSAGTKLMINVRTQGAGNYVPYITYIHNAFNETLNSVRVAWRNTTMANLDHGTNADHTFTGNWEVMTVPAETIPNFNEIVSNGVPTSIGTPNADNGYNGWANPTGSTLTNTGVALNRSILVGYMTEKWYEGAILKHNIWTP